MNIRPFLIICAAIAFVFPPNSLQAQQVTLGPDSQIKADVPHGTTTHYTFKNSRIYPGTERDYWVYVPKQYDGKTPACVMVFQDGGGYQDVNGSSRVPVVFDNLIAKGEMPVTVAVMVNPGVVPASRPDALPRFNRSIEYDSPDDTYARFLLNELLPEVGKTVKLTDNPNGRGLCGGSSGGIAAFVAAWFRPDAFRRVISGIGSFVDLRGGNVLPDRIRKYEPKPIRVYLQDNENDQDIYGGSWPIANRDMAAALKFAGYDYQFVTDPGGHDGRQLGARLPDALRWLWRDYPKPITSNYDTKQPVIPLIEPGETWQKVSDSIVFSDERSCSLAVDNAGVVWFTERNAETISKVGQDGKVTLFRGKTDHASGLAFGPDGKLYATQREKKRIVAYDPTRPNADPVVIAQGFEAMRLTVAHTGDIYAAGSYGVLHFDPRTRKTTIESETLPSSVCLSPDQSIVIASDRFDRFISAFQVQADGSLAQGQHYFDLPESYNAPPGVEKSMTVDSNGWLYLTNEQNVLVFDQAGRVNGILESPVRIDYNAFTNRRGIRNSLDTPPGIQIFSLVFGGPNHNTLYAIANNTLYRRKMRAKGVLPFAPPIKPTPPRL